MHAAERDNSTSEWDEREGGLTCRRRENRTGAFLEFSENVGISPVLHSRGPSSEINQSWGLRADSNGGLPMRVQAGRVRLAHRASPAPDRHCLNPFKAPELL